MKKNILIIPLCFIILASCSGLKEQKVVDAKRKKIEIALSFNTESYPWLLGTKYPQMAVWVKYDTGEYETIFITQRAGKNKWLFADKRPGALPVWSGIRSSNADMMLDAVTGATPSGASDTIVWPLPPEYNGREMTVYIEANVSFDYNDYYNKIEDTPGYSGVNGQPSVVWQAELTTGDQPMETAPEIIGHGHVLGNNSHINPDMSNITTASGLFHYIKISYHQGN